MREIRFATIAALAFAALTWSGGQPWAKTPKLPPTAPLPAPSEAAPAKPQTPDAQDKTAEPEKPKPKPDPRSDESAADMVSSRRFFRFSVRSMTKP